MDSKMLKRFAIFLVAFNSIERIPPVAVNHTWDTHDFQFHWTDSPQLCRYETDQIKYDPFFQFHWTDSSNPENSWQRLWRLHSFQFHWTDSQDPGLSSRAGGSTPSSFNSIERIQHHHGLCTLWKPAHLHYLDSLPLTPRLGVSCILWSPKLICFSVSYPWFFSCVYMGISIVTVSPLVYG